MGVVGNRTYNYLGLGLFIASRDHCCSVAGVCLSVCPSVTLRYRDHIGWNSWKIISRLISLTFPLSADLNNTDLPQREHPKILAGIGVVSGKLSIFDI